MVIDVSYNWQINLYGESWKIIIKINIQKLRDVQQNLCTTIDTV